MKKTKRLQLWINQSYRDIRSWAILFFILLALWITLKALGGIQDVIEGLRQTSIERTRAVNEVRAEVREQTLVMCILFRGQSIPLTVEEQEFIRETCKKDIKSITNSQPTPQNQNTTNQTNNTKPKEGQDKQDDGEPAPPQRELVDLPDAIPDFIEKPLEDLLNG